MRYVRYLLPLVLLSFASSLFAADARPNIVFLMADDQTTYSLGCYGTPGVETPNIDQLARDGMVFDRHYVSTAICMASRCNVMTGMFEYKHGCNFEHGPLVRNHWEKSYPMLLRKAGYVTAMAGKIGFEVADKPNGNRGEPKVLPADDFDHWGAGPGQTFYQTAKNKSMAKYAKEWPHSTLSYGAFGRDSFRPMQTEESRFACPSVSRHRTSPCSRTPNSTTSTLARNSPNPLTTVDVMASISRCRADRVANLSVSIVGNTVPTTTG